MRPLLEVYPMSDQIQLKPDTFHARSVQTLKTSVILRYLTQPARLAFLIGEQLPSAEVDRITKLLEDEIDRRCPMFPSPRLRIGAT